MPRPQGGAAGERNGQRRDRGGVPPLPCRQSRAARANCSTSIRTPCWWRWCCPRRRPMPASTRRRRRCSRSPTRRPRWWRSARTRMREYIKTIGLYRTKAKNVVALSRKLIEEHGGQVPREREALEALPGVGRKTANVVLNVAFGEPTIAVDTHIFRVGNRTGLAAGKTPHDGRDEAQRGGAGQVQAARPSLADPARALHVRRARARCARSASSPTCASGRARRRWRRRYSLHPRVRAKRRAASTRRRCARVAFRAAACARAP